LALSEEEEVMSIAENLKEEGKKEKEVEMVKNMLSSGLNLDKISEISGLAKEEIKKIKQKERMGH
jgi:predicted transposase YdaD